MYTVSVVGLNEVTIRRVATVLPQADAEIAAWVQAGNTLDLDLAQREAIFAAYKDERNSRLTESDWAVLPDVVTRGTLTQSQQDEFITYRNQLYWWLYNNQDQEQEKSIEELVSQAWPVEPVV
jgi:hypothetical protein